MTIRIIAADKAAVAMIHEAFDAKVTVVRQTTIFIKTHRSVH
jgi:hypothetical protein